ncbi:diacylglycerol kinase [Desulfitobacterium dichloroeliminans LMG P-21439]|uniref:Diacylglycerol kinase n=1 Tax=Desulfitobacterium dichloroeliminans (strain LMG P-21439 / DCA1) TaxID=871963 RepID=L0FCL2_DESDL|nr:diacylglycerol kinase [Desulfitobacterium dichloroeliminans]AGA70396.1 diacylglycerol kinase [Desulfitobacterium dichloroeliminans LMG P-21439]
MGQHHQRNSEWGSFRNAFRGIFYNVKTQKHFRIHLFVTIVVLLTAYWLGLERWEWAILFLTISSVLTAEAINTAVEITVDLAEPNVHPLAGLAKDVAAGAVLIAVIMAVGVGILLFGPPLAKLLGLLL